MESRSVNFFPAADVDAETTDSHAEVVKQVSEDTLEFPIEELARIGFFLNGRGIRFTEGTVSIRFHSPEKAAEAKQLLSAVGHVTFLVNWNWQHETREV